MVNFLSVCLFSSRNCSTIEKKKKKKAICDAIVFEKGQDVNQLFLKETIGFYFCRIMSNYTSGVF